MAFVIGFLGGLLVVALLAGGGAAGWKLHAAYVKHTAPVPAEAPGEAELRELREGQQAFRQLANYSAEVAYGVQEDALDKLTGGA